LIFYNYGNLSRVYVFRNDLKLERSGKLVTGKRYQDFVTKMICTCTLQKYIGFFYLQMRLLDRHFLAELALYNNHAPTR